MLERRERGDDTMSMRRVEQPSVLLHIFEDDQNDDGAWLRSLLSCAIAE